MYIPSLIEKFPLDVIQPVKYYAAHLPLYPMLVRIFAPIFNYAKSMIFVNIGATTLLAVFFYFIISTFKLTKYPLILTAVFLMLPRFLIVRSIGAPESLFILLILSSLYFFEKESYLFAGLFGGLATITKTPGILLFIVYILVILERVTKSKHADNGRVNLVHLLRAFWLLLIPLALFLVFTFYWLQYGDFFAYFHSGDNIHLVTPFAAFNSQSRWVGTAWLEDILFYFFLYLFTVLTLKNFKYRSFFYFGLVFFAATIFVQHRDIGRYSLPLWPLACIALERFFTSRKFLIAFAILLPAIYLYAWNFSLQNVMPVSDWSQFFSK